MSGILSRLLGSAAAAAITDAYFNLVTLLLNTTATNGAQNNTFLDSSSSPLTITRNGNTTQGTFTPFSQTGWSNFFNGTTDYLSPGTTATNFICTGTTSGLAATFEAWVFPTSWNNVSGYMNNTIWAKGGVYATFGLYNGTLQFFVNGGGTISSSSSVSLNTWSYIAVTLSGSTVTFYINGVSAGSGTLTGGIPSAGSGTSDYIAYQAGGPSNSWFAGYLSNFRISNVVRTISATPTTAFTSDANTVVLSCQSNRFKDNGTNTFTITPSGTPSVQAFSPFLPTAAYDAAVVGGSAYFDGTGDFLQLADSTAWDLTGDYTIEMWLYSTATPVSTTFFQLGSSSNFLAIYLASATKYITISGSLSITASTALALNSWNHMALVRSGSGTNNTVLYLNGVNVGQATNTTSFTGSASNGVRIGAEFPSDYYFNGYIAGNRIVNGTAVYTAAFTPPTAPLTAITNTSLLANYTNAGIFDSAAKNDLETGGNAQVSTTVAKWGTTSMYFDGTGDYLVGGAFSAPLRAFGTGDFTIEGWFYTGANKTQIILDTGTTGGSGSGMQVALNSSGYPYFYIFNSTSITSSIVVSLGTWTHVAWVRSNGVAAIYVNGVSGVSTANTSNITDTGLTIGTPNDYRDTSSTYHYDGYIDDFRVTKGYARYTANFTAPAAAFPLQ